MATGNIEARFIGRLLNGNQQDRKDCKRFDLHPEDFLLMDREWEYVQVFEDKYGKYPDVLTFKKQFPAFKFPKTPEPLIHYGESMLERRNKSMLIAQVEKVEPLINSTTPGDVNKAISLLADSITQIITSGSGTVLDWKREAKDRFSEYLKRKIQRKQGKILSLPYKSLNKMIPTGVVPENLITLMSRTTVGKTWMLCLFALHWWRLGYKVLFISKEMTDQEIRDRLDAVGAKIDWVRFQRGRLNVKQKLRYKKFLREVQRIKNTIVIAGDASLADSGLEALVSQIEMHAPDIVIVDGLAQYDGKGKSEVEKMLYISHRMKRIAKAKKIVVMQSIHSNRSAEGKKTGGGLGAASWSDALVNDADFFFELVAPDGREKSERLFKNLKGRNAAFGEFYINMKMRPVVDLSERSGGSAGSGQQVKLGGVTE